MHRARPMVQKKGPGPAAGCSETRLRSEAYRLLAACYFPPQGGLEQVAGELADILSCLCPEAARHAAAMQQQLAGTQGQQALQVDYARLFLGPYRLLAPPYGSVYLEGERRVMGTSTDKALDHYKRVGLDLSPQFQEAPDHIAAELEFMHYLLFSSISGPERGLGEETALYQDLQKEFLHDHLGAWAEPFCRAVEQNAETGFFQSLARATRAFLAQEMREEANSAMPVAPA